MRGAVVGTDVEQAGPDAVRDVRVERRRRLVQHEQSWLVHRRLDDADERALSRGQLHAHAVGEACDAEAGEPAVDGLVGRVAAETVETGEDRERLAYPEAVGERQVARDEADLRHGLRSLLRQAMPEDLDVALVGDDRTEQHQQRRRLAGAVRTQERDALAGADDDVDTVDRLHVLELLAQAARFEDHPHAASLADGSARRRRKYHDGIRRLLLVLRRQSLRCESHQPPQ